MAPVAIATLVLTAGSQFLAGQAAKAEAESQEAVADYNAQLARVQAAQIRRVTEFKQERQAKKAQRTASSLQARLGAAGGLGEGTSLLIEAEQESESRLENLIIGFEGRIAEEQELSRAGIQKEQARLFKERGRNVALAGGIKAGTTLLTGFAPGGPFAGLLSKGK